MKKYKLTNSVKAFKLLAVFGFGLWFQPLLKADVVVLQSGEVLTGKVLQQDANGVLIQLDSGTYRYPPDFIREVRKEAVAAPHVSNNGQRIPDWAQIVSLLANNGWADGLKQVPATVINYGKFDNVPYISFRCASGGYEINIFGDLNNPAAVQIGAMTYLKESAEAKTNCVNFICSVLANVADRKTVRALNWNQKDQGKNGGMTFETILPGEWGSYGGWWVSVYNDNALANARASEAELLAITQPRVAAPQPVAANSQPAAAPTNAAPQPGAAAAQPPATTAQPVATTTTTTTGYNEYPTYGAYAGWTADELANARPATPATTPTGTGTTPSSAEAKPASAGDMVYPRSYTRAGGTYGHAEPHR